MRLFSTPLQLRLHSLCDLQTDPLLRAPSLSPRMEAFLARKESVSDEGIARVVGYLRAIWNCIKKMSESSRPSLHTSWESVQTYRRKVLFNLQFTN